MNPMPRKKMPNADESGQQESTEFVPGKTQLAYLQALLDPEISWTVTAACKAAGVDRTTYYKWIKDDRFCAWLKNEFDGAMSRMIPHLDKMGIKMAAKDYRYFEFLQRKFGKHESQVEKAARNLGEAFGSSIWEMMQGKKEEGENDEGAD